MPAETMSRSAIHGHIAARIDRLPLTRVQWQLAILVEVTWGFIIFDTDGIGARLYPFVWRPNHIIDVYQYAVIQALQVGAGILLGVYLMSWIADRYGRRRAILLATSPWRHLHLALRVCHQFLGHGGAVGTGSAGCRRHRRDALGCYSGRVTSPDAAQQGAAGVAGGHGTGRGQRQHAGIMADP